MKMMDKKFASLIMLKGFSFLNNLKLEGGFLTNVLIMKDFSFNTIAFSLGRRRSTIASSLQNRSATSFRIAL